MSLNNLAYIPVINYFEHFKFVLNNIRELYPILPNPEQILHTSSTDLKSSTKFMTGIESDNKQCDVLVRNPAKAEIAIVGDPTYIHN